MYACDNERQFHIFLLSLSFSHAITLMSCILHIWSTGFTVEKRAGLEVLSATYADACAGNDKARVCMDGLKANEKSLAIQRLQLELIGISRTLRCRCSDRVEGKSVLDLRKTWF